MINNILEVFHNRHFLPQNIQKGFKRFHRVHTLFKPTKDQYNKPIELLDNSVIHQCVRTFSFYEIACIASKESNLNNESHMWPRTILLMLLTPLTLAWHMWSRYMTSRQLHNWITGTAFSRNVYLPYMHRAEINFVFRWHGVFKFFRNRNWILKVIWYDARCAGLSLLLMKSIDNVE